jgi:alpha-dioxygenase
MFCILQIIHLVDRFYAWHKLPVFLGLAYLEIRRTLHQRYNLINVGTTPAGVRYNPIDYAYRTADGSYNDPFNQETGSEGTFFGRNMMPSPQKNEVIMDISTSVSD